MKCLGLFFVAGLLTSCNTMIGVGRDTREGYYWSKQKIQEQRLKSQVQEQHYGAPVY